MAKELAKERELRGEVMHVIRFARTPEERERAFAVRRKVFVEEQRILAGLDVDEVDEWEGTRHLLMMTQDGEVVGTLRFRPYDSERVAKVERLAVLADYRKAGAGRELMLYVEMAARAAGFHVLCVSVQSFARRFYEILGYQAEGGLFQEADIEHIMMRKNI